jgi:hypothetical protein
MTDVKVVLGNHIEVIKEELEKLELSKDQKIEYFASILRIANIERNKLLREKVIEQDSK